MITKDQLMTLEMSFDYEMIKSIIEDKRQSEIRNEALEEAAKVVEGYVGDSDLWIARKIRERKHVK